MEFQEAVVIGRRRRADARLTLSGYIQEMAVDVCAVKPAKNSGLDAHDWEPVGEKSFKEICIRSSGSEKGEAYLLIVDEDGMAKACTKRTYPLEIALQMAWGIPLPVYAGRGGTLMGEIQEAAMRKVQGVPQLPEL